MKWRLRSEPGTLMPQLSAGKKDKRASFRLSVTVFGQVVRTLVRHCSSVLRALKHQPTQGYSGSSLAVFAVFLILCKNGMKDLTKPIYTHSQF